MKQPLLSGIAAAFLAVFSTAIAGDLDLGSPVGRTPYDSYLGPMFSVFGRLGGNQPDMDEVQKLVRESHGFRYFYDKSNPYVPQTPAQTEASHAGDCKAKSLWLAAKMDTRKVRFVVGKSHAGSPMSHAWIIWQAPQGWLVLDPTNTSSVLAPARISSNQLVPIYSYSTGGKFSHALAAAGKGAKYGDHM